MSIGLKAWMGSIPEHYNPLTTLPVGPVTDKQKKEAG
jgi:hypothetical protein